MSEKLLEKLLGEGPSLTGCPEWKAINEEMGLDGLPGITSKVEIGQHDIYLKTAWYNGRIVRIDITLSRGRGIDGGMKTEDQVKMETTRFDLARSWVENECRMASNLLQTGYAGVGTILEEWMGVEGYPSGYCPQLPGLNPETGDSGPTFQKGPLHAAAMVIKDRMVHWHSLVQALTNDA